jgi:autotransporter-associated beta strand protein
LISGNLSLTAGTHNFTIASGGADTDLRITAPIGGAGAITKFGLGTLEFANTADNTYTGDTVITDGTLLLSSGTSGDSTSNNIVVGDGSGAVQSAVLRLGQSNVIANTATITVMGDGFLHLPSSSDTVGAVTIQSKGSIDLGSGTLQTGNFSLASDGFYGADDTGKLSVTGTVSVGGNFGQRFGNSVPFATTTTIINNDGNTDAVTGTFAGLPEGTVFGTKGGLFKISYVGGDGNDVTITRVDSSAVLTIAPNGKSATFTDVDGDLVTVKTTKGTFTKTNFAFGSLGTSIVNGYQFQGLYPSADFANARITITAKPSALGGNGRVNLGALLYNGIDLASFTLPGDIAFAQGGDNDPKVPAIGKITVDSVGNFGNATSGVFPGAVGLSFREAPSVTIKGDVRGGYLDITKGGIIKLGGSLIGSANGGGSINSNGSIKSIVIGGSIIAVPGAQTGVVSITGDLGSITVGHDLINAVKIQTGGKLGAVTVKGGITGESATAPAIISGVGSATAPATGPDVAIGSVTVGLSTEFLKILGGYDKTGAAKNADAVISKVKIGGDFRSSSIFAGVVAAADNILGTADDTKAAVTRDVASRFSGIANIMIKGQAIGTTDTGDVFAIEAETIGKAVINGFTYKTKLGARSAQDTFGLGFASPGPGGTLSDFYLREITA